MRNLGAEESQHDHTTAPGTEGVLRKYVDAAASYLPTPPSLGKVYQVIRQNPRKIALGSLFGLLILARDRQTVSRLAALERRSLCQGFKLNDETQWNHFFDQKKGFLERGGSECHPEAFSNAHVGEDILQSALEEQVAYRTLKCASLIAEPRVPALFRIAPLRADDDADLANRDPKHFQWAHNQLSDERHWLAALNETAPPGSLASQFATNSLAKVDGDLTQINATVRPLPCPA